MTNEAGASEPIIVFDHVVKEFKQRGAASRRRSLARSTM